MISERLQKNCREVKDANWTKENNTLYIPNKPLLKCVRKKGIYNVFVYRSWGGNGMGYNRVYYLVDVLDGKVYRHRDDELKEVLQDLGE